MLIYHVAKTLDRYVLYNHRIFSYFVFTASFYFVSIASMFLAYLIFTFYLSPQTPEPTKTESPDNMKHEHTDSGSDTIDLFSTSDLSDTSRNFPTLSRQMPLHFSSRNEAIKREGEGMAGVKEEEIARTTGIQPLVAEADDEEDDEDRDLLSWRDSGIGTSLEEGDGRRAQRRRPLVGGKK